QLQEVLVGLEVGIGLSESKKATERLRQDVLLRGLLCRRGSRGRGGGSRLGDSLKGLAFVFGVALDGLDQVGDEIVATLQLDVDLAPRLLHEVAQANQAVVLSNGPEDNDNQNYQQNNDDEFHRASS